MGLQHLSNYWDGLVCRKKWTIVVTGYVVLQTIHLSVPFYVEVVRGGQ